MNLLDIIQDKRSYYQWKLSHNLVCHTWMSIKIINFNYNHSDEPSLKLFLLLLIAFGREKKYIYKIFLILCSHSAMSCWFISAAVSASVYLYYCCILSSSNVWAACWTFLSILLFNSLLDLHIQIRRMALMCEANRS